MERDNRLEALKKLLEIAASKGYVTFDIIMGCADDYALSLPDFDWLSNEAASRNIIIYDEEPSKKEIDEDEEVGDYAQVDYEAIYVEIVRLCPSLEDFVDSVRNLRPPQFRETARLKYLVKEGNAHARERMIEMHLRLALRIGFQRAKAYDADIEETIGDACVGLINAVDRYDPDTSGPFSSYASLWILQNVTREQPTQNPLMYFPVHKREDYYTVYPLLKSAGLLEYGDIERKPEAIELICKRLECNPSQLADIWKAVIPFYSLEEILSNPEEDEYRIHSAFNYDPLPADEEAIENLDYKILSERIASVLSTLTPRQEMIIKLRYGLIDGKSRTLEEVGQLYKLTRERIRQIELKSLRKLRHPSRSKLLKGLVDVGTRQDDQDKTSKKRTKPITKKKRSGKEEPAIAASPEITEVQEEPIIQKLDLRDVVWDNTQASMDIEESIPEEAVFDLAYMRLNFSLIEALNSEGLNFWDKRAKGGCLWVFGDLSIQKTIRKLEEEYGIKFRFKADGPSGSNKPAWWTTDT